MITVGTRSEITPIPPLPEATEWFDAGPIRIGVEYRILDGDVLDEFYDLDGRDAELIAELLPNGTFDDQGVSIHVCDAASGDEHVRFDLFDQEPHYHYIHPGEYHVFVPFDRVAFGDFQPYVERCLAERLPQMLVEAGAEELADRLDRDALARALPDVMALVTSRRAGGSS